MPWIKLYDWKTAFPERGSELQSLADGMVWPRIMVPQDSALGFFTYLGFDLTDEELARSRLLGAPDWSKVLPPTAENLAKMDEILRLGHCVAVMKQRYEDREIGRTPGVRMGVVDVESRYRPTYQKLRR